MTANPREHWLELRGALLRLVDSFTGQLTDSHYELLRDFIDNREFGVALEFLYSVVGERDLQISSQQERQFRELAELMGITLRR